MRRLSLMLLVVAVLAGCSSGSSNVAGSTPSSSPKAASSTSETSSPTSSTTSAQNLGDDATTFCAAFKKLETAKAATTPAAIGAAFRAAAADMRTSAPAAIKAAAGTYADLIDTVGKAAQAGTMDAPRLQQELTKGMAGKAQDIATVAVWVGKNCKM